MSARILIALGVAGAVAFGSGMIVWVLVQPGATTETSTGTSGSDAAQREHRERFFGGNPDGDVHGGQEMKPRW
ncbi:entry exclusion protein TrbK [Rhizobium rhizogenes]|uniref:Entry exclusion protein TrbK n=1 Tax=Rhizobium rhizogenes TaxID=359 RepID=A0AA88JQ35_RHIRH|nr:entry exclusion protein TrbK [Rhizobium rhizogenes]KAA3498016.1 entry exclusion protein TrbK [Rhizobium rhizogenes]KAA3521825.1 entry exclusion protein TrbK [Agrobacterium tumefaciens]